jgi:hypothetical protein
MTHAVFRQIAACYKGFDADEHERARTSAD